MRPALRTVSILAGIVALGCLIGAFPAGFPDALGWLIVFAASAGAAILFEALAETLTVLYQIRDRLPPESASSARADGLSGGSTHETSAARDANTGIAADLNPQRIPD